ncbi:hypothetical protein GJ631_01615 [Natronomonas sp. CBA1123]|jgi:hypothetical protein|uniref:hypothetical protein n=1 Tax=Natronomonas sp. CBA1123 TaxID=2668070 RepID=UPI0012EA70D3|nr:hypothetical protein [Natronomonas sp. CBA1123]MUV85314.1 hypothetical protein [Natronomonas sp. CBA1123]
MRILIVDQCSSAKKSSGRNDPLDRDTIDAAPPDELIGMEGAESYPAEELYQGRQQQRITEAKRLLEDAGDDVDRVFISAGFGLVGDQEELPLYDVTFADMSAAEIDDRAEALEIHEDLCDLTVGGDYDVVFFALGSDYYRSAKLEDLLPEVSNETFVVFFNQDAFEEEYDNGLSIAARTPEAKAYGTIVVALKGEYLRNFAEHRMAGDEVESIDDIEAYCTEEVGSQAGLDDYSSSNS